MKEAILGIILGAHKVWVESFDAHGFRADLSNADLSNADLSNADLSNADLSNADLSNADLSNANLYNADLSNADLSNADLYNANLYNADLSNADLSDANLRYANLLYANLLYAKLYNTNLRNLISGNNWQVFILQLGTWQTVITKDVIAIGCQQHSVKDWFNFDDETISKMDEKAFEWWQINKPILQTIYKNLFKN